MAASKICKNHAGRMSVGHCETCHIPLCKECAVTGDDASIKGKIFCSKEHLDQFVMYAKALGGKRLREFKRPSLIFILFNIVVVLGVAYAALAFLAPSILRQLGLPTP